LIGEILPVLPPFFSYSLEKPRKNNRLVRASENPLSLLLILLC
jgi:hypothetical protein